MTKHAVIQQTCKWCGLPCAGDGYLNSSGAGDPCGGEHPWELPYLPESGDHACANCGTYVCGIHTLDRGLCPDCGDPEEAAEVLASGQIQRTPEQRAEDDE